MFPFKQHLENGTGQFCTDSGIPSGILPSIGTARVPPVALNPLFQSEQSNEYLLHYRRSGRGHRGRRLSWTASLKNFFANRIFDEMR
jgi:hypothetical protein